MISPYQKYQSGLKTGVRNKRSNIITNVLIRQSTFSIASRTLQCLEKEGVGQIGMQENLWRKTGESQYFLEPALPPECQSMLA